MEKRIMEVKTKIYHNEGVSHDGRPECSQEIAIGYIACVKDKNKQSLPMSDNQSYSVGAECCFRRDSWFQQA